MEHVLQIQKHVSKSVCWCAFVHGRRFSVLDMYRLDRIHRPERVDLKHKRITWCMCGVCFVYGEGDADLHFPHVNAK